MEKKCVLNSAFLSKTKFSRDNDVFPISHIQVSSLDYSQRLDEFEEKESPYLVSFVNLHACFLFFPFRIVYSTEDGQLVVSTSLGRKITCAFYHVFIVIFMSLWAYPTLYTFTTTRRNITTVFYVSSHMSAIIGTFILLKIGWCNAQNVVSLANLTSVPKQDSKKLWLSKYLTETVYVLIIIVHFLHGVFAAHRVAGAEQAYDLLKYIFSPVFTFLGFHPVNWLLKIFDETSLRCIGLVIFSQLCSLSNTPLSTFLMLGLAMGHLVVVELVSYLREWKENVLQILKKYEQVKKAAEQLKSIFNGFLISYYIMSLSFFAHIPQLIINPGGDVVNGFILVGYLIFICVSVYFVIRPNIEVEDSLKRFIQQQYLSQYPEDSSHCVAEQRLLLIALRQDMEADPIGVSCHFYTVTKDFLCSTIGLVVTYCIIVLQMSNEKVFWEE